MTTTIKEAIEEWRTGVLRYDPSLNGLEEAVDHWLKSLIACVEARGFTEAELSEELDDNPRAWVEVQYTRIQGFDPSKR